MTDKKSAHKSKKKKSANKVGRPKFPFTEKMADRICRAVATCPHGLKRICRENPDFPTDSMIYEWKLDHPEFAIKYAQAKRNQAEILAEEISHISDDGTNDTMIDDQGRTVITHDVIQRARLRVDTRKWLASKLLPKLYGDKITQETTVTVKHEDALKELE